MITLYQSNQTEVLLDQLTERLRKPLSNALAPETIVVQSKGMERWISLQIAERLGCCANIQFPFPDGLVRIIFDNLLPEIDQSFNPDKPNAFDIDVMTWKLMALIPKFLDHEAFSPIKQYLAEDSIQNLKQLQISSRIADTFDQYIIYRPEMIHAWEKGKDDHWQAILWRALCENVSDFHSAQLGQMAIEKIFSQNCQPFAERIFIFGISALPRFHTQLLMAISHLFEVHIFLLNPSKEFWGDIKSKREISRIKFKETAESEDSLYLEEGHPLLASMGKLGKDFLNMLYEFMDDSQIQMDVRDLFQAVPPNNLLSTVQSQLLKLTIDKPVFSDEQVPDNDHSIVIHSCHSPMREVEVLYDQLLFMFESNPDLSPRDVLVMTPDIETYAPLIQAVFDNPDHQQAIPYSISDRNRRKESQIIDTFLMILDLPGSRLETAQMLSILECPAMSRRFQILSEDLPLINHWIDQTRIRWGESGEFRTRFGMKAYPENTWESALDRLFLGYAMHGESEHPFCGILPYDAIEGQSAELLGHFAAWSNTLFQKIRILDASRSLDQWISVMNGILDDCFLPLDEEDNQVIAIRDVLHRLGLIAQQHTVSKDEQSTKISFSAIKWFLTHTLEKTRSHLGFLSGHVTCCAMLPMRAIPFKVICIIGLNDTDYPRKDRKHNFNLISQNPRPGDRSIRNDDRYIFLEAIISARKQFYISYLGHQITDNAIRPPSVLISELLDYLDDTFVFSKGSAIESLTRHHRLQAFHPSYFSSQENIFSYSQDNCTAAKALIDRSITPPTPFWSKKVHHEIETSISINELVTFFKNPIQYFFNFRMGLYLHDRLRSLESREPFDISGLDGYLLKKNILEIMIENKDPYEYLDRSRASGCLPLGEMGRTAYYDLIDELKQLSENIQPMVQNPLPAIDLNLKTGGMTITGRIQNHFEKGLVFYRPATAKANDFIECWLNHLMVNIHQRSPLSTWFAGKKKVYQFSPVDDSKSLLENLITLFVEGQSTPLHFYPASSYEFAKSVMEGTFEHKALIKAQKQWNPNEYTDYPSESENPYYERYFQHQNPFDDAFILLAKSVFFPIIESLKDNK